MTDLGCYLDTHEEGEPQLRIASTRLDCGHLRGILLMTN